MKNAIILLSGGLDSTTVIAKAKHDNYALHTLSFNYGQKNHFEFIAAEKISKLYGALSHNFININLGQIGGSSLTTSLEVEKNRSMNQIGQDIPATYVPARNTIFLSYALALAEVLPSQDIFIGANQLDFSGYPDCRPDYFEAFEAMANLATRLGSNKNNIKIHTPLINLNKAEIIKLGLELGVDYSQTVSCYDPQEGGKACGSCDACLLRKKGFEGAGLDDPALIVGMGGE